MAAITRIERFIFEAPAWKVVSTIFALMLLKTGVWYIPNIDMLVAVAENPFVNPFPNPDAHNLVWTWLGAFLANLIGATSRWSYFLLHFSFSLAFSLLFVVVAFNRFSDGQARISLVLFAAFPVSATAYFWVGYDSLVLLIIMVALAFRGLGPTLLAGVALGMQHFELGFFAAGAILVAAILNKKFDVETEYSPTFCLLFFIGVIAGKLALIGIFEIYDIDVESGRLQWFVERAHLLVGQSFFNLHHVVFSVFGIGWLIVLKYADCGRRSLPFFIMLSGLLLLLPMVADQTRVVAIATFPLVSVYLLLNADFLSGFSTRLVSLVFVIWLIVPWSWVWTGIPQVSALPYDLVYLLHRLFGWFELPAVPALWPFDPHM